MDDLERYHYIQDLSDANDLLTSICVKENVLRKVRIKIPHICTRRYPLSAKRHTALLYGLEHGATSATSPVSNSVVTSTNLRNKNG
ncbi:hypothetical protein ABVK25_011367 [Lepraria finkii]|uniref:Uncharacterized protein n=1 Tax=Lepraria finkii TaxID=1340010 RepID=A0ABR4AQK7_9LECA